MRLSFAGAAILALLPSIQAQRNLTSQFLRSDLQRFDDRPDGCPACPSCFNCNNEVDQCTNNAQCNQPNGKCICPAGFGGDDCSEPLCGSLADGLSRLPRKQDEQQCVCNEGWGGINCNVCETNQACDALMPKDEDGNRLGGVCYKDAEVVKTNYQMCDITNAKIVKQLAGQIPQATVSCQAEDSTCSFQFWIDQIESFSCTLDTCKWTSDRTEEKNVTKYECEHIHCQCIPERMLCGKDGSIDIGEYLDTLIVGPATLSTTVNKNGETQSIFSEPGMNGLILSVFADPNIQMTCRSGECLYKTEVPGYEVPIPRINTPLIAGVIAGCALFIVACGLSAWYLSRRPPRGDGYVYLADSDDEASRITDHKAASLQFSGVSYMLNGRDLLSDIQGTAPSGQVTAIMGASGAGKTTCLDILARKNKRGTVSGEFYINGETVSDSDFRNMVGFVDQEDTMLPTLTVHETIRNSALLRLPKDMNISIKEQRVHEVEKQLGIFHIKDQLIGSEEGRGRGISGGEKRRVGIACELVTSPSILFLDEPTSGLDAYNAYNVIECLVNLAKNYNRTIIFSIHQPRSNIVALFDQLILLAKGRTVYAGPFDSCQAYFDSVGYQCPPGFNIADYLVDLTMHVGNPEASSLARQIVIPDPRRDNKTAASSILAVKSVASRSLLSQSPADSLLRPPGLSRKLSVKQKQDRELYTRSHSNYTDAGESVRPEEEDDLVEDGKQTPQNWHRLTNNLGPVPEQRAESFTDMPPALAGITADLQHLYNSYQSSEIAASIQEEIRAAIQSASTANGHPNGTQAQQNKESSYKSYRRIGLFRQFIILSSRTWKNLYRNPMLLLSHYAISIVMAVLCGYLFYGLTNDISGFQNRLGLLFFVLALLGFSTLTSLTVFASERLLFVRERANGYYAPITYFAAKVVFDIVPLRIIPPVILGIIIYPMTGMIPAWGQFWIFILVLVLFNLAAASVCLLIGILFKNQGVANLIGSLTMLFSLLFAGLLLNHDKMPIVAQWLQKLSIFHYGYEALMVNEVGSLQLIDKKYGLDIEVPGAAILSSFGFDNSALWSDVIGLAVLSAALLVVAYTAMHFLLVERR